MKVYLFSFYFSMNLSASYDKIMYTVVRCIIHSLTSPLTLSWQRSQSNRNQSIDLLCKSMHWFLYDRDFCHKRVKAYIYTLPERCSISRKTENSKSYNKEGDVNWSDYRLISVLFFFSVLCLINKITDFDIMYLRDTDL